MMRSIVNGDPLLLAGGAVAAAAMLVMVGTHRELPMEEPARAASHQAVVASRPQVVTGPPHLCSLPGLPRQGRVVVWQVGHDLMVAAPRVDDPLPEALHARAPTGVWHVPLQPWLGFQPPSADGTRQVLRLPGLELDCELTRED